MKKLIVLNIVLILAVLAATSSMTFAYFNSTRSEAAQFNTSRVAIDEVNNFPLQFSNLIPGEWQEQKVALRNTSTISADIYLQMGANHDSKISFCDGPQGDVLLLRIEAVEAGGASLGDVYNDSICKLYPRDGSSVISLLAGSVAAWDWRYFKIHVALKGSVDQLYYVNSSNVDTIRLIAVQHGAPKPQPAAGKLWPEGDPNY